jgi:hypothetical protein
VGRPIARARWLFLVLALLASACSRTCVVSGEVTYEGQPVNDGTITFLPADGKGPSAGGPIKQGKFEVQGLAPGPKVVEVIATKPVNFARSSEEMAKRYDAAKARGDPSGLIDPADVIPADAQGNRVTIEIKPGRQTHDFRLTKPSKKKT